MYRNQNGFSHVILAALIVLVVGVIGFVGYKVTNSNNAESNTASVTAKQKQQKQATTKDVTAQAQQSAQPETAPTSSPSNSAAPASKPAPQPTQPKPTAQTPAPQKRAISFTKGGGGQQDTVVRVSANLSEAQQGTCTYKFALNGSVRVERTSSVSNSNQCFLDVPVSAFPKSAFYSFSLSFVSSDGLVSATQPPYDIEVK